MNKKIRLSRLRWGLCKKRNRRGVMAHQAGRSAEEETCTECHGVGWVIVWGHVCNGDERKCQYMCPVEEQAPCPVCANPDRPADFA